MNELWTRLTSRKSVDIAIYTEIKNFEECLGLAQSLAKGKKHLMLGNGFSVALFPKIFNYKTLAENIKSDQIKQLFAKINTHDFEFVMRRLSEAAEIVQHYQGGQRIRKALLNDIEKLKKTLIEVISKCHPALPTEIDEKQYISCQRFLAHFDDGKKYSFNYDLILYWVYMYFKDNDKFKLKCDDGFRHNNEENHDLSVFWEIGREISQSLYYLHGAMHIFSDGSKIEKLSYKNIGLPLAKQVEEAVKSDKYPVFISEGTTDHKLARIKKNGYLARAFSSLKNITGNLFIFGHSLRDEDDHIFSIIRENTKIKQVFISLYGQSDNNEAIISKVQGWSSGDKNKDYFFYDSESAHVWR